MTGDSEGDRFGQVHDGRVVPVYAFTRGRTRSARHELPLEAVVTTTGSRPSPGDRLEVEAAEIVRMCVEPMSIVEIGSSLGLPVGVVRVLVGDLVGMGVLVVHVLQSTQPGGRPGTAVLERLLDGLRAR